VSLQQAIDRQRAADDLWSAAIDGHRRAEPNQMFAERLRRFSVASREQAAAMRYSHEEGLAFNAWPHSSRPREPPAELRRGSGRLGAPELWEQFDGLFVQWSDSVEQDDLSVIAAAYEGLSEITEELAVSVDQLRGVEIGDQQQTA
jgi:hypothetical protein